jgi:hypothetical protein
MNTYEVIVEVTYKIEADSEDAAWDQAKDNASGCDVEGINVISNILIEEEEIEEELDDAD